MCGFCLLDGVRRACASQLISPTPFEVTTGAQHHGPAVCKRVSADRAWEAPAEVIVDVVAQSCLLFVVCCVLWAAGEEGMVIAAQGVRRRSKCPDEV